MVCFVAAWTDTLGDNVALAGIVALAGLGGYKLSKS